MYPPSPCRKGWMEVKERPRMNSVLSVWKKDSMVALSVQCPGRFILGAMPCLVSNALKAKLRYSMPRSVWNMELTRFRGHLNIWETGVHDGKVQSKQAVCAGVPAADGRAGSVRT